VKGIGGGGARRDWSHFPLQLFFAQGGHLQYHQPMKLHLD
jgi:hypothetical protein